MLIRSVVYAIRERSLTELGGLIVPCMLISLGLVVVFMPMGADTDVLPGAAGRGEIIAVILGISNDYAVRNEPALIAGRISAAVAGVCIVLYFIVGSIERRRASGRPKPVASRDSIDT